MKRLLSLLLSLMMLLGITAGLDFTSYANESDGYTYTIIGDEDNETAEITFYSNHNITDLEIPKSLDGYVVTSIGFSAFANNENLKRIIIPDTVTSIRDSAFEFCTSLTNITMPKALREIGDYAFLGCRSLKSISIPAGVISIDGWPFRHCTALESINVDENNSCFSSADGVLFNKSKTNLLQYPLGNTRTKYVIPESVEKIANNFECCKFLENIIIPDSVTQIPYGVFGLAENLKNAVIGNGIKCITENAFYGCVNLESISIGSGVAEIEEMAFYNCKKLKQIIIPANVLNINCYFYTCLSLNEINVNNNNSIYSSENGTLFNKNKTELIQYPSGNTRTAYTIPHGVKTIEYSAFHNSKHLTNITIPNSVTTIGDSAFRDCDSLTTVTIPDSVTSIDIGAFFECDSLKDIYYSGTNEEWNRINISGFNECLTNATIHCSDGEINEKDEPIGPIEPEKPTEPTKPTELEKPTEPTKPVQPTQPATQPSTTASPGAAKISKPKSAKISKLTAGKKQFKTTWKKVSGVSGYQIQYSTSSKFAKKSTKTSTVKGSKKTSVTVKKLKSKKKYYVRIRTYKTVNGQKVYSSWSKSKTVKIK